LDEDILCGPDIPLKIDEDKKLGQGGYALVLRGEIMNTNLVGLGSYIQSLLIIIDSHFCLC